MGSRTWASSVEQGGRCRSLRTFPGFKGSFTFIEAPHGDQAVALRRHRLSSRLDAVGVRNARLVQCHALWASLQRNLTWDAASRGIAREQRNLTLHLEGPVVNWDTRHAGAATSGLSFSHKVILKTFRKHCKRYKLKKVCLVDLLGGAVVVPHAHLVNEPREVLHETAQA